MFFFIYSSHLDICSLKKIACYFWNSIKAGTRFINEKCYCMSKRIKDRLCDQSRDFSYYFVKIPKLILILATSDGCNVRK